MFPVIGKMPMFSLFEQPAPLKWVSENSSIWVSENSADFFRHFTDNYVAGAQPTSVPKRSIVLHFAPGETAAKTVYVMAPTDGVAEGDRTVAISHSVISKDAAFDNARVSRSEATFIQPISSTSPTAPTRTSRAGR